jgi:hypothetical protein
MAVRAVGIKAAATAPSEEGPFNNTRPLDYHSDLIKKDRRHTEDPLRIPMLAESMAIWRSMVVRFSKL